AKEKQRPRRNSIFKRNTRSRIAHIAYMAIVSANGPEPAGRQNGQGCVSKPDRGPLLLWARPGASRLTTPQKDAAGRRCPSFSPLACQRNCSKASRPASTGAKSSSSCLPPRSDKAKRQGRRRFY